MGLILVELDKIIRVVNFLGCALVMSLILGKSDEEILMAAHQHFIALLGVYE